MRLDQLKLKNVPRIEFLLVTFYVYDDHKGEKFDYLSERRLDARRFNKWNNNSGGVHNKQGKLQNDL